MSIRPVVHRDKLGTLRGYLGAIHDWIGPCPRNLLNASELTCWNLLLALLRRGFFCVVHFRPRKRRTRARAFWSPDNSHNLPVIILFRPQHSGCRLRNPSHGAEINSGCPGQEPYIKIWATVSAPVGNQDVTAFHCCHELGKALMFARLALIFKTLVALAVLIISPSAYAATIYQWTPCVVGVSCDLGDGGTGAITLTPVGTDTDFATSTVTDFQFTFDNGAPTISLSSSRLRL